MAAVGSIEPFNASTMDWPTCSEHLDQYLLANDVADDKTVATFFTVIGGTSYKLLTDLLSPAKPSTKDLDTLKKTLADHFSPAPLVIAERYRFHKRDQQPGEAVNSYVAELRRLARNCASGDNLDITLRDHFVCGLRSQTVVKVLLTEKNLTLPLAIEKANGIAVASRDASELTSTAASAEVHSLRQQSGQRAPAAPGPAKQSGQKAQCCHCGRTNHQSDDCRFKNETYTYCNKLGHIQKVCRSRVAAHDKPNSRGKPQSKRNRCHSLESANAPRQFDDIAVLDVLPPAEVNGSATRPINQVEQIDVTSRAPVYVACNIAGKHVSIQVDTGAALSVLPLAVFKETFTGSAKLQPSDVVLRTYSGEQIRPAGQFTALVDCLDAEPKKHTFQVVDTAGPALCGRDLLNKVCFDWRSIFNISSPVSSRHDSQSVSARIAALKDRYAAIFTDECGLLRGVKGTLQLQPGAQPKSLKARPLPYALRPKIEAELDRLEKEGVVTKVNWSEWATPIVPVLKPNGSIRICGDFKATLNPQLKVPKHPLPTVEDVFAKLGGGQHFSKIDLRQAYLHMEMTDDSKPLLTLNTHHGLYQLNRLGFGVASAPALWQKAIDQVLEGIPQTECLLDDIITTGKNDEEHLANLELILKRCEENGLRLNVNKCQFFQPSVEYCGHVVSARGIHKTDGKINAITNAPKPENASQLRSFLGLVNYYQKFLADPATTLHPLNNLLRKQTPWQWTAVCQQAFDKIRRQITSDVVLAHFDPTLPIRLATDASPYGVGAVLSHTMPDKTERPIAFASCSLSQTERKYAQIDKEALAIVWGVKKFFTYLFGREFTLLTDHAPLTSILNPAKGLPKLSTARLQRYAMFLSGFQYVIQYRESLAHANAGCLSRLPLPAEEASCTQPDETDLMHMQQLETLPVTAKEAATLTRKDPLLSRVYDFTQHGWPKSPYDADIKPFVTRRNELSIYDGCLMWGTRVVIPAPLQERILPDLHTGHPGVVRMKALARSFVWWPGIDQHIERLCCDCDGCQANASAPPKAPLHPWEWPSQPWQRLHIDFAGPFHGTMWLIVVDAHSKWPEVIPMTTVTTTTTVTKLRSLFAQHGLPEVLVSDNGPQFTSEEFQQFVAANEIRHVRSTPYHPATNGLAERFVQTFKRAMKSNQTMSDQDFLPKFLLSYRTTPHTTTNVTPSSLLMGRQLRIRLSLLKPNVSATVQDKQEAQKRPRANRQPRVFTVGSKVMARDYRISASQD